MIGIHFIHLGIGIGRRMYDTRTFTSIYGELVGRLVLDQHRRGVDVSPVVAHSALSRQFVDFFERYVPLILHGAFATTGALAFLAYYDAWLVPLCLGLVLPAWLINRWYGRQTLRLNGGLHDLLERAVDVIRHGEPRRGPRPLPTGSPDWRVRLSDSEALNFGVMELFILGLTMAAVVRSCRARLIWGGYSGRLSLSAAVHHRPGCHPLAGGAMQPAAQHRAAVASQPIWELLIPGKR